MNLESARSATNADADRVAELVAAAHAELAGERGGPLHIVRDLRLPERAATLLADSDLVVVGEYAGAVVGYAALHVEKLADGGELAVLDGIYVDPMAREVGVGQVVMQAVIDWCRARGCRGVDAVALPGNRALKNFFERFGLTARAIIVHRDLSGA